MLAQAFRRDPLLDALERERRYLRGLLVAPSAREEQEGGDGRRDRDQERRRSNSHAARTPPTAPNAWPCQDTPGVGTNPNASVPP